MGAGLSKNYNDYGLDKAKVVLSVQDYLINEPYTKQKEGLVKALVENSEGKIGKKLAASLVSHLF